MKFILISPKNRTVYNFRGDLIKEIQRAEYDVSVTGPDDTDIDKIEVLGAAFHIVPMNKNGTNPVSDLKYCFRLYCLFRREKPDVTLGYTVKPVVYGAIAARLAGVKNINGMVTGGGYTFAAQTLKAKILGVVVRLLYRIGFRCCHHVIFQNNDDRAEFSARGLVKESKCHVVHGSGVNIHKFTPVPLPEQPTFFMLSRLLKSKGVKEYLEAANIVKKQCPQARFLLLGKYESTMQDAVPRETIEEYIDSGIVELFDETNDVRPYYEMCSVYVLPSYREGTPRTVLEAMAMGRPIITTDAPGCRGTVCDGVNGFLVPVRDSEALAKAMLKFVENPQLSHTMGKESREFVTNTFDVDKVNAEMLDIMGLQEDQYVTVSETAS